MNLFVTIFWYKEVEALPDVNISPRREVFNQKTDYLRPVYVDKKPVFPIPQCSQFRVNKIVNHSDKLLCKMIFKDN